MALIKISRENIFIETSEVREISPIFNPSLTIGKNAVADARTVIYYKNGDMVFTEIKSETVMQRVNSANLGTTNVYDT